MENFVVDDTPPVDSGLLFSFRKWKVSPQPRDAVGEEAYNYFKKARDLMEALILNSKRVQVKQNGNYLYFITAIYDDIYIDYISVYI